MPIEMQSTLRCEKNSNTQGNQMKIGFIGAGKVGFSLGRYFMEHHMDVSGYYSQNPESAKAAAVFTQTAFFETLEDVVRKSEVIFLTVQIAKLLVYGSS